MSKEALISKVKNINNQKYYAMRWQIDFPDNHFIQLIVNIISKNKFF